MNLLIELYTIKAIKNILAANADRPQCIRVQMEDTNCKTGMSVGLVLDEKNSRDVYEEIYGVTFLMDEDLYDKIGDIKITHTDRGFILAPLEEVKPDCNTCKKKKQEAKATQILI